MQKKKGGGQAAIDYKGPNFGNADMSPSKTSKQPDNSKETGEMQTEI